MIEVDITQKMTQKALAKAEELGNLNNSILKGKGNIVGFLGEEVFANVFPSAEQANTYDYDFVYKNKRVEVKTKDRTVIPKPYYDCSVSDYNATQKSDYYVFCSLLRKGTIYTKGYLLGFLSVDEFKDLAEFIPKGHVDPRNNMKFHCDCWNIQISKLNQFSTKS